MSDNNEKKQWATPDLNHLIGWWNENCGVPENLLQIQLTGGVPDAPTPIANQSCVIMDRLGNVIYSAVASGTESADEIMFKTLFSVLLDRPVARVYLTEQGPYMQYDQHQLTVVPHSRTKRTAEFTIVANG